MSGILGGSGCDFFLIILVLFILLVIVGAGED